MRNISAWSIRNPVIPLVLFTFLLAMGLMAFARMDVNLNPDITSPAASVFISQPGAAPPDFYAQPSCAISWLTASALIGTSCVSTA